MGQRHQMYVIAQVGSRYRVLAALHHHWLWAEHAVRQSRIMLETLRREGNLAGIRRELQRAEEIDWEEKIWVDEQKTRANESTFPFLATCLFVSATLGQYCPTTALMPIDLHPTPRPASSSSSILPLCFPLRDSLLSPSYASSLLTTMPPLLLNIRDPFSSEALGTEILAVAERFANLAGPRTTLPIPAQMYSDFRQYTYGEQEPLPKFSELKADEWTLLVTAVVSSTPTSDAAKSAKHTFLSRTQDGELEMCDAEGFFEVTISDVERRVALLTEWNEGCKALEQGDWSVLSEERIKLQVIEEEEAKEAMVYLTAFNATVDEYEEANQEKLQRSRKARDEMRAKGNLVIRL